MLPTQGPAWPHLRGPDQCRLWLRKVSLSREEAEWLWAAWCNCADVCPIDVVLYDAHMESLELAAAFFMGKLSVRSAMHLTLINVRSRLRRARDRFVEVMSEDCAAAMERDVVVFGGATWPHTWRWIRMHQADAVPMAAGVLAGLCTDHAQRLRVSAAQCRALMQTMQLHFAATDHKSSHAFVAHWHEQPPRASTCDAWKGTPESHPAVSANADAAARPGIAERFLRRPIQRRPHTSVRVPVSAPEGASRHGQRPR